MKKLRTSFLALPAAAIILVLGACQTTEQTSSEDDGTWKCEAKGIANFRYDGGATAYIHLNPYYKGNDYPVSLNSTQTEATGTTGNGTPFVCRNTQAMSSAAASNAQMAVTSGASEYDGVWAGTWNTTVLRAGRESYCSSSGRLSRQMTLTVVNGVATTDSGRYSGEVEGNTVRLYREDGKYFSGTFTGNSFTATRSNPNCSNRMDLTRQQ